MSDENRPLAEASDAGRAVGGEGAGTTGPDAAGRRPRVRMTASERRSQLLSVARELFAEKGYEAASIEELALRADVSKPVVYEHFGGKQGIYAVVVDREVGHLSRVLIEAIETGGHPRAIVERAALALFTYIETNPSGFRLLLGETPAKRGAGMYSGLLGDVAAEVEKKLAKHFHRRGFDDAWAPAYAHMLVGLVAQEAQWWLDDRQMTKEQVVMHVVNLTWNGLAGLERAPLEPRAGGRATGGAAAGGTTSGGTASGGTA